MSPAIGGPGVTESCDPSEAAREYLRGIARLGGLAASPAKRAAAVANLAKGRAVKKAKLAEREAAAARRVGRWTKKKKSATRVHHAPVNWVAYNAKLKAAKAEGATRRETTTTKDGGAS